jgi:2'-5' RNA ligase
MPRLFVALEIGPAARECVGHEQRRLAETMRGSAVRWVKQDQLHITLVFLGDVRDERAARAIDAMHQPLPQAPFQFELGGLGTFPPRGAPRALWIAVKSGAEHVVRVQASIAERFADLGFDLERRPFSPHLTLARWRDSRPSDRLRTETATPPPIVRVDARSVTLFQSRVSSAGSTYTQLAECLLEDPLSRR